MPLLPDHLFGLDQLPAEDALFQNFQRDLAQRYSYALTHGRDLTPIEVILRTLVIKHLTSHQKLV